MIASNAFIPLDSIVSSVLLKRRYSIHFYMPFLKLAADAVRELQLSHMPLLNHTILVREPGKNYFLLPEGYTDYVSVGIRVGEQWREIAVNEHLMPFMNKDQKAEYSTYYSNEFNKGEWTDWLNPVYKSTYGSFSGDDFFDQDYQVDDSSESDDCCPGKYPYRKDAVSINALEGVIICPVHFPCNSLYLTYVGVGQVDTMTHIPVEAQNAIECHMKWQYAANKRTSTKTEKDDLKQEFYAALREMKARMDHISLVDIQRIMNRYYGQQNYFHAYREIFEDNCGCGSSNYCSPDNSAYINSFTVTLTTNNLIINSTDPNNIIYTVTDPRLKGKTLSYLITDAQQYNRNFWTKLLTDDFVQSTILTFYLGQTITFVTE